MASVQTTCINARKNVIYVYNGDGAGVHCIDMLMWAFGTFVDKHIYNVELISPQDIIEGENTNSVY